MNAQREAEANAREAKRKVAEFADKARREAEEKVRNIEMEAERVCRDKRRELQLAEAEPQKWKQQSAGHALRTSKKSRPVKLGLPTSTRTHQDCVSSVWILMLLCLRCLMWLGQ